MLYAVFLTSILRHTLPFAKVAILLTFEKRRFDERKRTEYRIERICVKKT